MRERGLTDRERRQRRRQARVLNREEYLRRAREKSAWPVWQLALLGTAPDEEAGRIGRTLKRCKLGIPTYRDRWRRENC
jgi:hypothetical protein